MTAEPFDQSLWRPATEAELRALFDQSQACSSDKKLKEYLAAVAPDISFRYVAEWCEYQLSPERSPTGSPIYSAARAEYISKPSDSRDCFEARADVIATACFMQNAINEERHEAAKLRP